MRKLGVLLIIAVSLLRLTSETFGQWQQVNCPAGCNISSIVTGNTGICVSTIPSIARKGCVYFSSDNGTSWGADTIGLPDVQVNCLAINGDKIFAGTGNFLNGGGVYLSTNNGAKSTRVVNGIPNINGTYPRVISLMAEGSNVFAGTNIGIFLSTDNGTNWKVDTTGLGDKSAYNMTYVGSPFIKSGTNIFTGTYYYGVFLTTNNGTNWHAVNSGLPDSTIVRAFALNGTTIYAGTNHGLFLTTNNGTSWSSLNHGNMTDTTYALSLLLTEPTFMQGHQHIRHYCYLQIMATVGLQ